MANHAEQVIKELSRVAIAHHPTHVFEDWLALVDATLRMLPSHALSALHRQTLAEDPEDIQVLWAQVRDRYGAASFQHFARAFHALLDSTDIYREVLGDVYMDFAHANEASGQFFTPWDLCLTMAQLTCSDLEARIRERMQTGGEPVRVHDPAVGSGRLLLAVASLLPDNLARSRWIGFYGQDIDVTCVQMSQINMRLYGLNGSAIWLPTAGGPEQRRERAQKFPVPAAKIKEPVR